jgi:autotransporter passenger strand-loop-strand repeat protein
VVSSGGTASAATISSGGQLIVFSGGIASGTTLSGGTEVISAGGVAGGTIIFGSSGKLVIDQVVSSMTFGASVSGLATSSQTIDLANMAFNNVSLTYSGGTTSGTLTVANGAETTSINLIGNYTSGSFKTGNDGNGGTLVYDPPIEIGGGTSLSLTDALNGHNRVSDERENEPLQVDPASITQDWRQMAILNSTELGSDRTVAGSGPRYNIPNFDPGTTQQNGLFVNYVAALSDTKQFASNPAPISSQSDGWNASGTIAPTFVNPHHA